MLVISPKPFVDLFELFMGKQEKLIVEIIEISEHSNLS